MYKCIIKKVDVGYANITLIAGFLSAYVGVVWRDAIPRFYLDVLCQDL